MNKKTYRNNDYGLKALIYCATVFVFSMTSVFAAVDVDSKKVVKTVSYDHVLNWSMGLIIVLCLFFACIWFMRKMGALPIQSKQNMKVITGLSLGMREKLILVQVGDKQLVLGVTPSRIDNLLVLEGEELLFQDEQDGNEQSDFSQKLKQLMSGSANE